MDQERTYNWISERLREWRAGTISDRDRSEVRRMAETDPFIADAIEGYDAHPDQPHDEYLEHLSHRIRRQKRGRRRWLIPNLTVTAVAASLLFIVLIWVVAYRVMKEETETFAATETTHTLEIVDQGDTAYMSPATETYTPLPDKKDKTTPTYQESRKQTTSPAADQQELTENSESVPTRTDDFMVAGQANAMLPSLAMKRVTGQVLDIKGEPLMGAHISIPYTNLITTSDMGGRFELFLPQAEQQVEVHHTGYERANLTMRQGEEDIPVILEEVPLSMDAVALNKSKNNRNTQAAQPKVQAPGKDQDPNLSFTEYLQKNARYPLEENLEGQYRAVEVAFSIPDSGKPKNERIIQSSGSKDHDHEALRLIRSGPLWECLEEKVPCEMRYTIYFK